MPTGRINGQSKLVSVRLPLGMIEELKRLATLLDRPYQTIMKEAIEKGLPVIKAVGKFERRWRREVKTYNAPHIKAAQRALKRT